jgi:gliding motility-associated-like protein
MMTARLYFILFIFLLQMCVTTANCQPLPYLPPTCGTSIDGRLTNNYEEIKNSSLFIQMRDSIVARQARGRGAYEDQNRLTPTSPLYTIPVVVHIIKADPYSVTDTDVTNCIADLNAAFAHQGAYSVDTNGYDARINFCLAKNYPDGGLTNGITRTVSFYSNNDADMESFKTAMLNYWDPKRYLNIWLVDAVQGEIMPSGFYCGSWNRMGIGGYASAGVGAVVSNLGTPLVAHEVGHYFSLLHTFAGGCDNNNCLLNGDLVCDTPPDATTSSSPCNNPDNSCTTDTLSGPFTIDVPDNTSNFMDYGSTCPTVFTRGQGERMRLFIETFNNGSLIDTSVCVPPCTAVINPLFEWGPMQYPITGDSVTFRNLSSGGSFYSWYVDSVLINATFEVGYRFSSPGSYEILLKVYNQDSTCFASYSANLIINCGVVARFSPSKRIVASKIGMYSDPVTFINKSYGGVSFRWYIISPGSSIPILASTNRNLVYDFPQPGSYTIYLEAINGSCVDRSPSFNLPVLDPIPDGFINFKEVDCYKKDSIRLVIEIGNHGFDTIPSGLTVTFYDRDPRISGAIRLFNNLTTTQYILGKCTILDTHIVAASRHRLDTIFAVFDEAVSIPESSYSNNITSASDFQFRLWVSPTNATIFTNTDQALTITHHKGPPLNVAWRSPVPPSCFSCLTPTFRIVDTTTIIGYGENLYQCPDSGVAVINVFPLDARIQMDSIFCYKNDSLLIKASLCLGNNYSSIKRDLVVDFYDRDSLLAGRQYLGRGFIPATTSFSSACTSLFFKMLMTTTGRVIAYLNPDLRQFEATTINNVSIISYTPFDISFPVDIFEVFRGVNYQLRFNSQGDPITSLLWSPSLNLSCSTCFSPLIKTNVSQTLNLKVATLYQCTDSASVYVKAFYQNLLRLPNIFTPNGDGVNDYFYVIADKEVKKINVFQILNRWGEKVFEIQNAEPNSYKYAWDGTKGGIPVMQGTYVYYIVVELIDGSSQVVKGNITLLR